MIKFLLLALLLTPVNANAMQIKEGVADGIITARISNLDLNRLKVISDSISSIKFNDGQLEILEDHGEIYLKTSLDEKLSAFINTDKGYTYQLLLTPESIPSEQIFIKNNEAIIKSLNPHNPTNHKDEIISLIEAMREGLEHKNYTRIKKHEFVKRGTNNYKLLMIYQGENYIGEILEYTNYKPHKPHTPKNSIALSYEPLGATTKLYVIKEAKHEKT